MPANLKVSASLEDYLEAIYHTVEAKGAARAKDIVMRLGVHNSSVTQALRSLSEKELINYAPYDVITLTDRGERIALDVVKRHTTLSAFLHKVLGLPDTDADEGACLMEHAVNPLIMERLVKFVEYFDKCPLNDVRWDDEVGFFCGKSDDDKGGHNCGRDVCGHPLDIEELTRLKNASDGSAEE
ncbi:metal-dependent transcriptional regulator [bacterium]|nr:metal-dependent transcriptional regulator [bacterium]